MIIDTTDSTRNDTTDSTRNDTVTDRINNTVSDMTDRDDDAAAFPAAPTDADAPPVDAHPSSDFQQSPDSRRLAALIDQAWDLAREGGLSPAATDAQKWQAGDLVGAMGRAVAGARDRLLDPVLPVTPEARGAYRLCAASYDAFLGAQGLARGTLVDAGLTAATFPPGDPIRSGPLSFSHARALTRLRSAGARSAWAARAVREGLSVARLQTLLNIEGPYIEGRYSEGRYSEGPSGTGLGPSAGAGQLMAPGQSRNPPPPGRRLSGRSRPRHGHVCALTGAPIVDVSAMVELRLDPEAAEGFDLSALAGRASPRGGAALPGPDGSPPRFPLLLRFAGLSALVCWLAARREFGSDGESDGNASF